MVYLLPKYSFSKGIYNFTIVFTKFGLSTTIYTFVLDVKGFNLKVVLYYPTTLVTGSDYTISVQITYANSTSTLNLSSLLEIGTLNETLTFDGTTLRFVIFINNSAFAQNIGIGDPLSNINCLFVVYVRYTNGTNATLTYITTTNANGQAFYTISGSTTSQISQIYGIGADLPSSTYNEGFNYINTTVGSHITITNPSTYLTELIIVF